MSSKAQRRAKYIAKQEKLKRERAEQQGQSIAPVAQPIETPKAVEKIQAAADVGVGTDSQARSRVIQRPPATRADWVIASVTVALLAVAVVQGIAMVKQNDIMQSQMAQTDKQLDLVKREQRAWLATSAAPLNQSPDNTTLDWRMSVRNVGQTPATIKYSVLRFIPNNYKYSPPELQQYHIAEMKKGLPHATVIAPGDTLSFGFQDINQATAVENTTPEKYQNSIAFARMMGVFIYEDVWGKEHTLVCVYRNNPVLKELTNHNEYGYSD
jgi:hypothetical protein